MAGPLVSVIVPVFNRQSLIADAVGSLVRQTVQDIEIIVVDDGSSDGSADVAERAGDDRVRIVGHGRNCGIPAARNSGLEAACGRYVAWLDSDDVAHPQRLERQLQFLERHPEIALAGSAAGRITAQGRRRLGARVPFRSHETLCASLLFRSPFQQSSIIGRADVLKAYEYRAEYPVCEDLDMFIRVSRDHRVANLGQALVDRRVHNGQIGRSEGAAVRECKKRLLAPLLEELGIELSDVDLERHVDLGTPKKAQPSAQDLWWTEQWLRKLKESNARAGRYDGAALATVCARNLLASGLAAINRRNALPVAAALLGSSVTAGMLSPDFVDWLAWLGAGLFG